MFLSDRQHAKPLRVQPTTRKRKRARDANERKYRKKKTKALPSSVEVQSDLRRKRVLAEAQATNGMESGNEEERFRSTTRETSRSERRRVNKKRVRAEADGQNTSEEENASNNGTWPSSQLRDGNADYGDLWDEESLLTAPPRVCACSQSLLSLRLTHADMYGHALLSRPACAGKTFRLKTTMPLHHQPSTGTTGVRSPTHETLESAHLY